MNIEQGTILVLGGAGLVGQAVVRRLLDFKPRRIVLVSLREAEVRDAAASFEKCSGDTLIETEWGNVFFPSELAQLDQGSVLADPAHRGALVAGLLDDLDEDVLERSFLYQLLRRYNPDAVVDCINTATALAYQDVLQSARELLHAARHGAVTTELAEKHVLTLTMPQLIRHVQIALAAMRSTETKAYVKIGTSGTGGMGLNIPYTHSEERPSRTLLTKSAVAGAHSLLLFLIGRTPGAPATIEIKPTATIGWREIAFGPIRKGGKGIARFDCPEPLPVNEAFGTGCAGWVDSGKAIESVHIDVGENGVFSREEFETVTALGSMELITPEEVAEYVVMELEGRPTGRNIVAALDSATAGPTYRAAILRASALERLQRLEARHGVRSVAFEMLGPPRLTKILYEAYILSRLRKTVRELAVADPEELSREASELLAADADLRSLPISVGLPILLQDRKVYRAEKVIVLPVEGDVERAAARGWVDVSVASCEIWVHRARRVAQQAGERGARAPASGSDVEWGAMEIGDPVSPSRFASWVFQHEDGAERIKR